MLGACHSACAEVRGRLSGESFFPSTIAVPGIELRWAGLVAPAFACLDANAHCGFFSFFFFLFGSLFFPSVVVLSSPAIHFSRLGLCDSFSGGCVCFAKHWTGHSAPGTGALAP